MSPTLESPAKTFSCCLHSDPRSPRIFWGTTSSPAWQLRVNSQWPTPTPLQTSELSSSVLLGSQAESQASFLFCPRPEPWGWPAHCAAPLHYVDLAVSHLVRWRARSRWGCRHWSPALPASLALPHAHSSPGDGGTRGWVSAAFLIKRYFSGAIILILNQVLLQFPMSWLYMSN